MNINGRDIPQWMIEGYLRACRYNQEVGTTESDQTQQEAHCDIMRAAGLTKDDPDYNDFWMVINTLVDDLLRKGY